MASSVSSPVVISQATKRTHAEMSNSELSSQQSGCVQPSLKDESPSQASESKGVETKVPSLGKDSATAIIKSQMTDPKLQTTDTLNTSVSNSKNNAIVTDVKDSGKQLQEASVEAQPANEVSSNTNNPSSGNETKLAVNGTGKNSPVSSTENKETKKIPAEHLQTSNAVTPSPELRLTGASSPAKSNQEPMETSVATGSQDSIAKSSMETAASQTKSAATTTSNSTKISNKPQLEDGEEPEKKAKISASNSSKEEGKSPHQILELMDKTFEQRRKVVTKQMPSIPELKELYPDLFTGKQLLLEFQRITKIDIDQKIQEFCVRYATAVIEMAEGKKEAAPVLARWEQAKQENDTLRQYWDMVTALCLLPLHFGENFVEMVMEIGEDEEVVPQGKIVPCLVARGNIFRTDEFFLIAENTIVQEFEEFTIAFASLYSSYWVFNMVYPETIENTYNYIQRCIVRQREPGAIPLECKNFTKALLKWNKVKDGK